MRLVQPTDFDILTALSDGKRKTAANIAQLIEKNRGYINTRLPILADYGLIERVGPAPNSGLYVDHHARANSGRAPRPVR
jgi:predicted transcriptional regulator